MTIPISDVISIESAQSSICLLAGESTSYQFNIANKSNEALEFSLAILENHFLAQQQLHCQFKPAQGMIRPQEDASCTLEINTGANAAIKELQSIIEINLNNADSNSQAWSVHHAFDITIQQNYITQLLPAVIRKDAGPNQLLTHMINILSHQSKDIEHGRTTLARHFDPYGCPDHFVPLLVRMLDLDRIFSGTQAIHENELLHKSSCPLGRIRNVIARAMRCSQWRGTSKGLLLFLQTACDSHDFSIEEDTSKAFHIIIHASEKIFQHKELIQKIIDNEKPAYVTSELLFNHTMHENPIGTAAGPVS